MSLEINFNSIDTSEVTRILDTNGINYQSLTRKGFDGIAIATLVIDVVGALGGILTPVILHLLEQRKPEGEISINGIVINGLTEGQVREIIVELIADEQNDKA